MLFDDIDCNIRVAIWIKYKRNMDMRKKAAFFDVLTHLANIWHVPAKSHPFSHAEQFYNWFAENFAIAESVNSCNFKLVRLDFFCHGFG